MSRFRGAPVTFFLQRLAEVVSCSLMRRNVRYGAEGLQLRRVAEGLPRAIRKLSIVLAALCESV